MSNLVIAYTGRNEVIEYDAVEYVESEDGYIVIHMVASKKEHTLHGVNMEVFISGYTDWLILKQAALGIDIENKANEGDNK